jgi:diguanylate cyclase (GGDEF)-like protein
MLHSLDIFTLGVCSMLASGAFGTVFFVLWHRRPPERHLLHWAWSNWLYVFVLLALYTSGTGHPALGAIFLALMGLSDVLVVTGVYRAEEVRPFRLWMIIPPLAAASTHLAPAFLGEQNGSVVTDVIQALGLAIAMGLCGITVLREHGQLAPSRGRRIAGFAMLAYLPGYVAVIVIRIWFPESNALLPRIPIVSDQILLGILNLGLLAIPNERAHERLRIAASRDPLTGAWNRAGLANLAPHLLQSGGAVVAIDIDLFKSINDRHGHATGDGVLVCVAEAARSLVDPMHGALFRIGGDEFIAIVPKCNQQDAAYFADQLRRIAHGASGLPPWTLSIGIALIQTGPVDVEQAIKHADTALYRAKALGRDRVQVDTPAGESLGGQSSGLYCRHEPSHGATNFDLS